MVVDNVVDKDVANKLHKALRRWSRTFVKILSTSNTHFKNHTEESADKCKCCEKVFLCWKGLKLYMTGERPSTGELCAKTFSGGNKLKKHMQAHTGGKPCQCRY